jgi:hypothetical protein
MGTGTLQLVSDPRKEMLYPRLVREQAARHLQSTRLHRKIALTHIDAIPPSLIVDETAVATLTRPRLQIEVWSIVGAVDAGHSIVEGSLRGTILPIFILCSQRIILLIPIASRHAGIDQPRRVLGHQQIIVQDVALVSRFVVSGLVWTSFTAFLRNIEEIRGGVAYDTGRSVIEGLFGGTGDIGGMMDG